MGHLYKVLTALYTVGIDYIYSRQLNLIDDCIQHLMSLLNDFSMQRYHLSLLNFS